MFTDKQTTALNAKLNGEAVKQRKQGGAQLSYLEGYTAIENANRIFGYGNWQGRILSMVKVDDKPVKRDNKDGYYVAYTVEYEATVYDESHTHKVAFTDIGFGSGTSYVSLGDATESATKEAVTDAMKRTLRNFGNQFGLALYDKEQRNVSNGFDVEDAQQKIIDLPHATIEDARAALKLTTREELGALYSEIKARGTK